MGYGAYIIIMVMFNSQCCAVVLYIRFIIVTVHIILEMLEYMYYVIVIIIIKLSYTSLFVPYVIMVR